MEVLRRVIILLMMAVIFPMTLQAQDKSTMEELSNLKNEIKSLLAKERDQRNSEINSLRKELLELRRLLNASSQTSNQGSQQGRVSGEGGYAEASAVEFRQAEAVEILNELIERTGSQAVETANEESPVQGGIAGFGDLVASTVKNKLPGISFEAVYTSDVYSNFSGGLRRKTTFLDNVDLTVEIDAEELFGWPGSSFFLYGLGNNGGSPSENIGDLQTASNIDADNTWKIYEAWFQQELFAGRLSFLVGLYDLNSEFDVIETAGLFMNSSFGIGPDFSQTGLNGPSIFPTTSMGFRAKIQPSETFYFQAVVLDGVPGNPDNGSGTQIKFGGGEGLLLNAEVAFLTGTGEDAREPYGKIALGAYHYTTKFPHQLETDIDGNPIQHRGKPGFYLLAERSILRDRNDPAQGLAVFGRVGFADSKIYQFGSYLGGGLVYTGLLSGRNEDQLGLAVATVHNGRQFKQAARAAGAAVDNSEVAFELTYRAILTPWLTVQPDFQYIVNPGTDKSLSNAFAGGARFEITF